MIYAYWQNNTLGYDDFINTKVDIKFYINTKKNTKRWFSYLLSNIHFNALVRRKRDMAALKKA